MLFIKMLHNMKLHHWPKSSVFAARRNEFLSRNLVYNSQVGLGAVIRDHHGSLKVVATKVIEPTTVEIAEAMAARYGLEIARRLGFDKVILDCEAANVVKAIKSNGFNLSPIGVIYQDIKALKDASQLKFSLEESISKLLDRRWTLEIPDTKVHQITLSVKQTSTKSGIFGNVNFSMDAYPKLGDAMMDERCKDPSFYIIRDDLLHPFVNGNKARKLDALLPIIEDCSGTDVVTCGGCQSAHATAVAVSCAERGLRSHLLLRGEQPEILTGYNLVSSMYGNVTYIPRSIYTKREEMLLGQANAIAGNTGSVVWFTDILDSLSDLPSGRNCIRTNAYTSLEDGMKKVVIIKEGAGDAVALLGIIRLVRYLSQSHILGKDRPYNFVIDSGTGTTAIGFALGALILNLPWKVTAVMLADTLDGYKNQENRLISDFKRYAASHLRNYTLKNDLVHWVNRRTPRKFGNVMEGEIKACQQVANQTGVLVDPIYTLSAWELAVNLSQEQLDKEAKVVMLHTGGTLGMFGLAQRYKSYFNTLKDGPPQ